MSQGLPVLSEWIVAARGIALPLGDVAGQCLVCARETPYGHAPALPKTFLDSPLLCEPPKDSPSNFCRSCWHLLCNKEYRLHSWLVTTDTFEFLPRSGVRRVLDDIPSPPFALYLTTSRRKHGWLRVRVVESTSRIPLTIDEGLYWTDRDSLSVTITRVQKVATRLDRWRWLRGKVRAEDEGRLALEDGELYEWYHSHGRDPLVLAIVYFCCPTRKETVPVPVATVVPTVPPKIEGRARQGTLDAWF